MKANLIKRSCGLAIAFVLLLTSVFIYGRQTAINERIERNMKNISEEIEKII